MTYHLFGAIAAAVFLLTVMGEWLQLQKVWRRRKEHEAGRLPEELPTAVLSMNQIMSVFLACFAIFIYSLSLTPANHYLAWPRFIGAALALLLLREVVRDRRELRLSAMYMAAIVLMLGAPSVLWFKPWATAVFSASQGLLVATTIVLAQGYTHQIVLIRRNGRTGAVSLRFHQLVLASGISTLTFSFVLELATAWPFMLLASVSALLKMATLWHFRWVRLSPLAAERRAIISAAIPAPLL